MMTSAMIVAATALAIALMIVIAASRAWRAWLEYKKFELAARPGAPDPAETAEDEIGVRIELAAVRERLKKLEMIASGVEL